MNKRIRCACGKSRAMPWCDGSHNNEQWACEPQVHHSVNRAFYAPPALTNLAKRLAWRFDGEVISPGDKVSGKQLVVIDDGSDLNWLKQTRQDFEFEQSFYIGIDFTADILAHALGFSHHLTLNGSLLDIFVALESNLAPWFNGKSPVAEPHIQCEALKRVFVSHAVADEALLLPVVDSLRQLTELDLFLCFDSIEKGEKWRRQIDGALNKSELFIYVISKASVQSTYCAYEVGCAHSLNKPICLISIDGTLPPAYISQIHCIDIQREISAKPWLDVKSALMLELLNFTAKMCKI